MALNWKTMAPMLRAFKAGSLKALVLLLAVPLLSMLAPSEAKANVVCLVDSAALSFGTSDSGVGTVNYTCTNYTNSDQKFGLCIRRGRPNPGQQGGFPRMQSNGNNLKFQTYSDPGMSQVWTNSQNNYISKTVVIPAGIGIAIRGSFSFYGQIQSGQTVPAGNYTSGFDNAILGFVKDNGRCGPRWNKHSYSGQRFWLPVSATVSNDCIIEALGDLDLGSVVASPSTVSGYTKISIDCPNGTPFTVGLQPSNGNNAGQGLLSGTGANGDQPPYSLHSSSASGPIWGNTASVGNVGNGVSGTGTGNAESYGVYVAVPGTEYTPDRYSDKVLVTVHF